MRSHLPVVRKYLVAAILVGAVGACGPLCGNGKLNLSNAHISPLSFSCPTAASSYQYPMNINVDADNQSSGTIAIKSASTAATVTKLSGTWEVSVGQKSGDPNVTFSPSSIGAGSKTTLKLKTIWSCTNSSPGPNTYADFSIVLTLITSAGKYSIQLPSHRLRMQ